MLPEYLARLRARMWYRTNDPFALLRKTWLSRVPEFPELTPRRLRRIVSTCQKKGSQYPFCVLVTGVITSDYALLAEILAEVLSCSWVDAKGYHNCTSELCTCSPELLGSDSLIDRIRAGWRNRQDLVVACRALTAVERQRLAIYPVTIPLILVDSEQHARREVASVIEQVYGPAMSHKRMIAEARALHYGRPLDADLLARVGRDFVDLELPFEDELAFVADGGLPVPSIIREFLNASEASVRAVNARLDKAQLINGASHESRARRDTSSDNIADDV